MEDTPKEQRREDRDNDCTICHNEPITYQTFPCGHSYFGKKCAMRFGKRETVELFRTNYAATGGRCKVWRRLLLTPADGQICKAMFSEVKRVQ